jgi:hypothetical protein
VLRRRFGLRGEEGEGATGSGGGGGKLRTAVVRQVTDARHVTTDTVVLL